ncbi:MAG: glycosyltransferase [Desulfovibrionaceae bacterium]|nr:glycosyltransferase [Desulfovibrionaceae bacterium]
MGQQYCLFITHSFGGGAERVLLTLLAGLNRAQFRPVLACLHPVPEWRTALPPDIPCFMPHNASFTAQCSFWRQLYAAAKQADVVIGSLELQSMLAAALLAPHKSIGWVHKNVQAYLAARPVWKRSIYTKLLCWAVQRCRTVVCVSNGGLQALQALCPSHSAHCCRIYNPVPLDQLKADALQALPPSVEHCFSHAVILAVGRLAPEKQFDTLIRAFHRLRQQGCNAHLCIVGEGAERAKLEQLRQHLQLEQSVFLPGFHNPAPFMARARVCVLSSRFEGLPTVLIEALSIGCPIISTDCPSGPHEITAGGSYGTLVPLHPNLELALARAMAKALTSTDSPALRQARQARAEKFSVGNALRAWEQLFQQKE